MKSVEETTLLTKLEELVQMGKKKKSVLEYKEIMDHQGAAMNFEEAKKKLAEYGQTHVLNYFDELTQEQKEELLTQMLSSSTQAK